MDERRKALEAFSKQLSEGLPFAEGFIGGDADIQNNSLLARNLSEDALAHQALKNTGLSVPNNNASVRKKEDFLNKLAAERYPEIKDPNIRLGVEDSYTPSSGGILVRDRGDIIKETGKTFHETAHKYDNDVLGFEGKELDLKTLRDAKKSGMDLKGMDPAEVYEMYAKNHHAKIPDLREGTFGLGALKSMLKTGNFKSLAGPVAGLGLGAALMPDDASASDFIPILDQAESAGSAMDDKMMMNEVKSRQNYEKSPAFQDKRGFTLGEQPQNDVIDENMRQETRTNMDPRISALMSIAGKK